VDTGKRREIVNEILHPAGIAIDGSNPWDLRIKDERFFQRVLRNGSLGLGESFMDGWWECEHLDEFFCRLMPLRPEEAVKKNLKLKGEILKAVFLNQGSK